MTPIQETTAPRVGLPWRFVEQSTAADGSIIWTYQTRVIASNSNTCVGLNANLQTPASGYP